MKLTKEQEAEVILIYNEWWHSYLNGDVKTYEHYLDDDFRFVGSTVAEDFLNKRDTTQFFDETADQLAGKTQKKNSKLTTEYYDGVVFITELADAYLLFGDEWTFYGKFRFSSMLRKKSDGWRFIYQHFSVPDSKTHEGETIGFEQVSKENQELRDAIKRRTAELESKNRELEIEAAIERVRTQSMAMHHPDDLDKVNKELLTQLQKLQIDGLSGVSIWLIDDEGLVTAWDLSSPGNMGDPNSAMVRYDANKFDILGEPWRRLQNSDDDYFVLDYSAEKLQKAIKEWAQVDQEVADGFKNALSNGRLKHQWNPIARHSNGILSIDLVKPPADDTKEIVTKMAGAFSLAYRRFLDLQKAEAQAREAQIEAALERVRSRSLAMQKSDELNDVAFVLFEQLQNLGGEIWGAGFVFCHEDKDEDIAWFANEKGILPPVSVPNTHDPAHVAMFESWKNNKDFVSITKSGKDLEDHYDYMMSLPQVRPFFQQILDSGLHFPTWQQWNAATYKQGYLLLITTQEYNDADILMRFAKVFEQSYTRYLDLQKAEDQAHEAEIEAALERVRSRSLAMHKPDELQDVVRVVAEELKNTGVILDTGGAVICTYFQDSRDVIHWTATEDPAHPSVPYLLPYFKDELFDEAWESKSRGDDYFAKVFSYDVKNAFWNHAFEHSDYRQLPDEYKKIILESESHGLAWAWSENSAIMIPSIQGDLPSAEEKEILIRFAKVFEQSFIRFLDLKKSEAQAREAQIETALEKVRSRTMAMQSSDELTEAATEMFSQIEDLGLDPWSCGFNIFNEDKTVISQWVSTGDGRPIEPFDTPATEGIFKRIVEQSENDEPLYIEKMEGKNLEDTYRYMASLPTLDKIFEELDSAGIELPKKQVDHAAYFKHGYLMFITYDETPEFHSIFKRFAKVFEQTYTRFLDLKKAEAQAREAQIEMALEKVRSRTMAMQHSDELIETSELMFEQIKNLNIELWSCGFSLWYDDDSYFIGYNPGPEGKMGKPLRIPLTEDVFFTTIREAKRRGEEFLVFESKGKSLEQTYHYMDGLPVVGETMRGFVEAGYPLPTYQVTHCGFFSEGHLMFITQEPNPEAIDIFKRFTKVFEQTYTRFLDLQKAEAQAREAKIEAALEKVRSRTMGMQKGEELQEVAVLLYKELIALGVTNFVTCGYVEVNEEIQRQHTWVTSPGGDTMGLFHLPLTGDDTFDARYAAWKNQETIFHQSVAGQVRSDHLEYAITTFNSKEAEEMVRSQFPDPTVFYCFNFHHGYLHIVGDSLLDKEEENLLARFTKVFEQTYTRFLDLQKAEAQAREAEIEAALERVRSRSMGMQKSSDLQSVVDTMYAELERLGLAFHAVVIQLLLDDTKDMHMWINIGDGSPYDDVIHWPYVDVPMFNAFYEARTGNKTFDYRTSGEAETKRFFEEFFKLEVVPEERKEALKSVRLIDNIGTYQKHTGVFLMRYTEGEFTGKDQEIVRRFSKVFEQTYTRFLDLQKAEEQAKEAKIELSLERIRSQVTAMRESSDLFDIVVSMRSEFISLGHEADYFWHMRWLPDVYEMSMTSEDGHRLGMVIKVPKFVHDQITDLAEWEKGSDPTYVLALDVDEAWDYIENMNEHGDYEVVDPNAPSREDIEHIGGLTFIIARTTHGEIGYSLPGVVPRPPKDALDTLVSFAGVFDLAYKRFEDLKAAEQQALLIREERDRLEIALKELHATQDQLIQQEKLASLGQLTAGIAHEIKNPLNFVNNFSDLSVELIEETKEELSALSDQLSAEDKERVNEALKILHDIDLNLRKIHEHGSRADSIVKSMLEHSRGGSGKMEPTDMNGLVKEFVNLTFHGMRASKNPISVDMEFELDDSIGEVPLIAEDFSRVIINLSNNAFDAMREKLSEKAKVKGDKYSPNLTIRTQKTDSGISIEIQDNGPGIPEEMKDKILQPFFTTKKGTEGTGLGLSITNDIIKAHGGELSINSTLGTGSLFKITLNQ